MYPILFNAFGYPVSSYGFFLSIAHLAGIALLLLTARSHQFPLASILDLLFAVTLFGLVGARLGYAFNYWSEFRDSPASLLSLNKGGLSFFGGFPIAFIAFLLVLKRRHLPILEISDLVSPVLPFSLALARIGCFGKGCCFGAPTNVPWAVHYDNLESRVPPALFHLGLHPSQLYEAAFLLLLASLLWWGARKRPFPPGMLATFSILAYSLFRFFADAYRGDLQRGFWGLEWMSPTQAAALLGILASPIVLWICLRLNDLRKAP